VSSHFTCYNVLKPASSPKPNLPTPDAYELPSPPATRDLGPPPAGYGRFTDPDRSFAGGAGRGNQGDGPRRNLDDVLCFKVSLATSVECYLTQLATSAGRRGIMQTIAGTGTFRVIVED
jgi:hypothetical protein